MKKIIKNYIDGNEYNFSNYSSKEEFVANFLIEMDRINATHVEFDSDGFHFFTQREETDEEYDRRTLQENNIAVNNELFRRQKYEELKKIYENT